jgi:hypothetical protein
MSKRTSGRGRTKGRAVPGQTRLPGDKATRIEVHRLIELLTEVFEEESWQAPLTASLEGLTAS